MARVHPSDRGDATTHVPEQENMGEGRAKHADAEHEIDRDSGV